MDSPRKTGNGIVWIPSKADSANHAQFVEVLRQGMANVAPDAGSSASATCSSVTVTETGPSRSKTNYTSSDADVCGKRKRKRPGSLAVVGAVRNGTPIAKRFRRRG